MDVEAFLVRCRFHENEKNGLVGSILARLKSTSKLNDSAEWHEIRWFSEIPRPSSSIFVSYHELT